MWVYQIQNPQRREPLIWGWVVVAWIGQGGLNFHSGKIGVMLATEELLKRGLVK